MFNWATAPTFAAMLLFWLLGAYVLTRSPRSPISLTAVGAQVATACYLLGIGMAASADTVGQAVAWLRNLQWGATVAPALWYWLTLLLLTEQDDETVRRYTRAGGMPLGVLLAGASAILTGAIYVDDLLIAWSQASAMPAGQVTHDPFVYPNGLLYPGFVAFLAVCTLGALGNVVLSWRRTTDEERRHRFAWLLASGVLFLLGANLLGLVNWLSGGVIPPWMGHLVLAAAMAVMGWNVAAYSLLFKGQVIRTDFFYFVTALTLVCAAYGLVFLLAGTPYSFSQLQLFVFVLITTILAYALVDLSRGALDRLFFGREVQQLRSNMAAVAQHAALAPDLDTVLQEAQAEIAEVSAEHLVRLTEQALRRLNSPAALARIPLGDRLPCTLLRAGSAPNGTSQAQVGNGAGESGETGAAPGQGELTPLERARALREVLTAAIERLKPADGHVGMESPGALQYHILHEEYLQGLLNKQIMARHAISEGTFHRNRRQAIRTLAEELQTREARLALEPARSASR